MRRNLNHLCLNPNMTIPLTAQLSKTQFIKQKKAYHAVTLISLLLIDKDAILPVINMNENMAYGHIVRNQLSATDQVETVDQSIVNQQTDTISPVIKMDDNVAYGHVNQLSTTDHVESSLNVVYEQVPLNNSNQDVQQYDDSSDLEYY